jgi:starvation-inducible DNA-binding protein
MNYIGLNEKKVTRTVNDLNRLLSNYHVYYQNLRNFHWNVQGQNFFMLHEKFEEMYNDAREKIDEIAERILTLRHIPLSRMSDYLSMSDLEESTILQDDVDMVDKILQDHEQLIRIMREVMESADDSNDEGTIDLIGGFLENLEKTSWMLDAWRARRLEPAEA